jgi:hypothetical protein
MRTKYAPLLVCLIVSVLAFGQGVSQHSGLFVRRYRDGEKLTYHMKGNEDGKRYEIRASGVVKRDAQGHSYEEYAWSNLVREGVPVALPPASVQFRQVLSLDPELTPSLPNLAQVPVLIGPITDLLTFYSDFWLTIREAKLRNVGDRFSFQPNMTASWADGRNVILGQSTIDFEMSLESIDNASQTATLLVRHVPPKVSPLKLPAAWMAESVADTQNNWVSIRRSDDMYLAAVGKETFDVQMNINLADGVILSGILDNIVQTKERECTDATVRNCGEARSRRIARQIEIVLER